MTPDSSRSEIRVDTTTKPAELTSTAAVILLSIIREAAGQRTALPAKEAA